MKVKVTGREEETNREIKQERKKNLPSLGSSPNGRHGWGWVKSKPGPESFSQVSYVDAEILGLGLSSAAFPDTLSGRWIESRVAAT